MNRATTEFVSRQRIGHLATADRSGKSVVVQICFANGENDVLYTPIDDNPSVSVVFDTYSEDWNKLAYVITFGEAALLTDADERNRAENLLRDKYPQYETYLSVGAPIIRIKISRSKSW